MKEREGERPREWARVVKTSGFDSRGSQRWVLFSGTLLMFLSWLISLLRCYIGLNPAGLRHCLCVLYLMRVSSPHGNGIQVLRLI